MRTPIYGSEKAFSKLGGVYSILGPSSDYRVVTLEISSAGPTER
jgi:hypothetical protein